MIGILIVAGALTGSSGEPPVRHPRRPPFVSMIALIADADRFDGKLIQTEGYVALDFEGTAVYLSENDYKTSLTFNAIYLAVMFTDSRFKPSAQHYCWVTSVFSAKGHGHMGVFSGEIRDISAIVRIPSYQ